MRLWSLNPKYLDGKGLVALWREGLLAQKVLQGRTTGYRHHPQLERFRAHKRPLAAIATYLAEGRREAALRGNNFDASKIDVGRVRCKMPVSDCQLRYELAHLRLKLKARDPQRFAVLRALKHPQTHPLFKALQGDIEAWERGTRGR